MYKDMICSTCGSKNVVWDAWATWNYATQQFELDHTFEYTFCRECDGECNIEEVYDESNN